MKRHISFPEVRTFAEKMATRMKRLISFPEVRKFAKNGNEDQKTN